MSDVDPHRYEQSATGWDCGATVMRDGGGDQCGLPRDHPVHQVQIQRDRSWLAR